MSNSESKDVEDLKAESRKAMRRIVHIERELNKYKSILNTLTSELSELRSAINSLSRK